MTHAQPEPAAGHIALVGPTASGKSAVAMALARRLGDVEIVSVDSMQVYRQMDIGTAKPTAADQAEVPHHLIDLVDPWEPFDVSRFQEECARALAGIEGRGHRAVLVGGTGLYHRAIIDELQIPDHFPELRQQLEATAETPAGIDELYAQLRDLDPLAASRMRPNNGRRIVRALEVTLGTGRPFSSFGPGLEEYAPTRFALVGLRQDPTVTWERIRQRYDAQVDAGFLDEVRALAALPQPLSVTAAHALGYREMLAHLRGELALADALEKAVIRTRQFARRQRVWFRRDPRVVWVDAPGGADGTGARNANDVAMEIPGIG